MISDQSYFLVNPAIITDREPSSLTPAEYGTLIRCAAVAFDSYHEFGQFRCFQSKPSRLIRRLQHLKWVIKLAPGLYSMDTALANRYFREGGSPFHGRA